MTPVQQKLLNKNQKMACLFFIIFLSIHSAFPIIFKKPVISPSFPHLLIALGSDPGPPVAEHAWSFHCTPALLHKFLNGKFVYPKQQHTELQFKKLPHFLLSSKFVIKNKPRKLSMVMEVYHLNWEVEVQNSMSSLATQQVPGQSRLQRP